MDTRNLNESIQLAKAAHILRPKHVLLKEVQLPLATNVEMLFIGSETQFTVDVLYDGTDPSLMKIKAAYTHSSTPQPSCAPAYTLAALQTTISLNDHHLQLPSPVTSLPGMLRCPRPLGTPAATLK